MGREAFLHASSKEARAKGKEEGYSEVEQEKRGVASAKVLYWTSLGATGMVMANGYKMTLVMVDSSSSASWAWRPKNRRVYTSEEEDNTA